MEAQPTRVCVLTATTLAALHGLRAIGDCFCPHHQLILEPLKAKVHFLTPLPAHAEFKETGRIVGRKNNTDDEESTADRGKGPESVGGKK
jgi:hypothetical protein